jgi:hypothetical protein
MHGYKMPSISTRRFLGGVLHKKKELKENPKKLLSTLEIV